jgi:hypothetical protein
MFNVTREVISDLWPLYRSDDVSAETRRLVEAFLESDPVFARSLEEAENDPLTGFSPPTLPPDHEMTTLQQVKRRLWGYPVLLFLAFVFSGMAFGRIVSDTSWDVSPRSFIITAAVAGVFWVAFFVTLYRGRRSILVRLR